MINSELEKQGTNLVRAFVRSQMVVLELLAFGFALHFLQQSNVNTQTIVAIPLFCLIAFTLFTMIDF